VPSQVQYTMSFFLVDPPLLVGICLQWLLVPSILRPSHQPFYPIQHDDSEPHHGCLKLSALRKNETINRRSTNWGNAAACEVLLFQQCIEPTFRSRPTRSPKAAMLSSFCRSRDSTSNVETPCKDVWTRRTLDERGHNNASFWAGV